MNSAIHAAAPQERGVRGVDDSVHRLPRDVPLNSLDFHEMQYHALNVHNSTFAIAKKGDMGKNHAGTVT